MLLDEREWTSVHSRLRIAVKSGKKEIFYH